ncbi:PQQ-binding-like beta-propeller repeat protein [Actinoplanes sp. ATCC 53533]|uniref:outer membrane protein assembly factor BamB family protein n=1 Tax=Actinoplanes sp. ATCC 53533 TaxID=1288362 RepID=UPI001F26C0EA|nr:PQQ-binding-like beta-propeller repeat protein [Actinoplanes sp. ATCC 53533]
MSPQQIPVPPEPGDPAATTPAAARSGVRRRAFLAAGVAAAVGGAGYVINLATRPETGDVRWSYQGVSAMPAVAGDAVYGTGGGVVTALNLKTGRVLWKFSKTSIDDVGDEYVPSFTPAVGRDLVHVASQSPHLVALNAADGGLAWLYRADEGQDFTASPVLADGTVYAISSRTVGSLASTLHAIDAASGARRWTLPVGDLELSAPAVAGDLIYVSRSDHDAFGTDPAAAWLAVDADTGVVAMTLETGGNSDRNPPALAVGDRVYLPSGKQIAAVQGGVGRVEWQVLSPGLWTVSLVWGGNERGGHVFMTDNDGVLYALDSVRGELSWTSSSEAPLGAPPAYADGMLYAPLARGELHLLSALDGSRRAVYRAGTENFTSSPVVTGESILVSDGARLHAIAR